MEVERGRDVWGCCMCEACCPLKVQKESDTFVVHDVQNADEFVDYIQYRLDQDRSALGWDNGGQRGSSVTRQPMAL